MPSSNPLNFLEEAEPLLRKLYAELWAAHETLKKDHAALKANFKKARLLQILSMRRGIPRRRKPMKRNYSRSLTKQPLKGTTNER